MKTSVKIYLIVLSILVVVLGVFTIILANKNYNSITIIDGVKSGYEYQYVWVDDDLHIYVYKNGKCIKEQFVDWSDIKTK